MTRAAARHGLGLGWGLVLGLVPEAWASPAQGWLIPASLPQPGDVYLSGGLLLNGGTSLGLGAELSLHYFLLGEQPLSGVGLFGQWQAINGEHRRVCLGAQGTFVYVGAELGVAQESGGIRGARTTSVHVAPFIALGLVVAGVRVGVPVATRPGDRPGYGVDVGLTLALKLPVPVYKNPDNL